MELTPGKYCYRMALNFGPKFHTKKRMVIVGGGAGGEGGEGRRREKSILRKEEERKGEELNRGGKRGGIERINRLRDYENCECLVRKYDLLRGRKLRGGGRKGERKNWITGGDL